MDKETEEHWKEMWALGETLRERKDAAYSRYRSSGFGLMASVITLSAGGIAAALGTDKGPSWMAGALLIPIWSGLIQQLLHFQGERHAARAAHFTERTVSRLTPSVTAAGPEKMMQAANQESREWAVHWMYSEMYFGWADFICTATVLIFLATATACVYVTGSADRPRGQALAPATAADTPAPALTQPPRQPARPSIQRREASTPKLTN